MSSNQDGPMASPMDRPLRALHSAASMPFLLGVAIVASLWLLARPYTGIRHDAMLYMAQVLRRLHPEALSQDLFFAYGSQDSYSIFSWIVARLYVAWGLATTQLVLLVGCLLALTCLLASALRALPHAMDRWMGLAAVAVFSHLYGGVGVFAFGESFVTARTLAEPLGLAAMLALLNGRLLVAGVLWALSFAAHPLIALPVLAVGWAFLCLKDRRWLWAALLLPLPPLLALMGRAPFHQLLQAFDADWWDAIVFANAHVFLLNWAVEDWQVVAVDMLVLFVAQRQLPPPLKRLAGALLIAGPTLLLVSFVGADLGRNVLLTALQAWRVLWLVHLFALALVPFLLRRLWTEGGTRQLAAWALLTTLVATNGRWELGWVFVLWVGCLLVLAHRRVPIRRPVAQLMTASMVLAILGMIVVIAMRTVTALGYAGFVIDRRIVVMVAIANPVVSLGLATWMFSGWSRSGVARALACVAAVAMLFYALINWDRRNEWSQYIESSTVREHPFSKFLPDTAQVYWHDDVVANWMLLKRPSFISPVQGAGILFNRETALEYSRRRRVLALMALNDQVCKLMAGLGGETTRPDCPPSPDLLQDICSMSKGPDYLVLRSRLEKGLVANWRFESAQGDQDYFLYDCKKLK